MSFVPLRPPIQPPPEPVLIPATPTRIWRDRPLSQAVPATAPAVGQGVKGETQSPLVRQSAQADLSQPIVSPETIGIVYHDPKGGVPATASPTAQMSQNEKTNDKPKRQKKRWKGLASVQVRVRVEGDLADTLTAMSPKMRGRAIAYMLHCQSMEIDLAVLASDEFRRELARANANLNMCLKKYFQEHENDGLEQRLAAVLNLFESLNKAGCQ